MLTQDRHNKIIDLLNHQSSVTLNELMLLLHASESTVRRDLTTLAREGKLIKVHGGATRIGNYSGYEADTTVRADLAIKEKQAIARYAATIVGQQEVIYIDAGTTTEMMIPYLPDAGNTYVTNAISHAQALVNRGLTTYILGGQLKRVTGAVIGTDAVKGLQPFNFSKGFFGANGISSTAGFSTPDPVEASVKRTAVAHCQQVFILADSSKFECIAPISFAPLSACTIITNQVLDKRYLSLTTVLEVSS